jgi:hypothetical protein
VSVVKDAMEQVPEQHEFPGAQTAPVATHCAGTVLEGAILGSTCEELSEGVADMLGVGAGVELDDGESVEDGGAELLEDEAEVETDMVLEPRDGRTDDDALDETPREDDTALQLPNSG